MTICFYLLTAKWPSLKMCGDTWWDGSRIRFHNDVQSRGRLQTLQHKTGFGTGVMPTVNWFKVRSALQLLRLSNRLIIHSDRGADRSALASADVHPTSPSQLCFLDGMPLLCPLTCCVVLASTVHYVNQSCEIDQ